MNEIITHNGDTEALNFKCKVTTPSGIIHCDVDNGSPITLNGYLPHFAQFLHEGGQLQNLIDTCPLVYKSNNAPEVKDFIGTIILSILSGHNRYSHMSCLYGDEVSADILGMNKIVSHDSVQRGLDKIDESQATKWLNNAYLTMYEPLLTEQYILDLDPTVKTLYGSQEGAAVGYNPHKPGRNSHCLHSYFIGSLRILLDVEIHPGNETAGKHSTPRLWSMLDTLPPQCKPSIIRGDIGFGINDLMTDCEGRLQKYIFKLKRTKLVKNLISDLEKPGYEWKDAGQGWLSHDTELKLSSWPKKRRVVVLKRRHELGSKPSGKRSTAKQLPENTDQMIFPLEVILEDDVSYEYQVLVTNTEYAPDALSQLYRDRGDCENNFDELKNQWGWGGFNSKKLARSQIMMRLVGLVYNWWNIFCRLAEPKVHREAITSRKSFQKIVGRLTKTSNARKFYVTAVGEDAVKILNQLSGISRFLNNLRSTATQLTKEAKWSAILTEAFKHFLSESTLEPVSDGNQVLLGL